MFTPRTIDDIQADYVAAIAQAGSPNSLDLTQGSPFYTLARANSSVINDQEVRLNAYLSSSSILLATGSDLDQLGSALFARNAATTAGGTVLILPTTAVYTISIGLVLTDLATGLQFICQTAATTSLYVNTSITVKAAMAGSAYNESAGTILFSSNFPNATFVIGTAMQSNGTYSGDFYGGLDAETDASYRNRLLTALLSATKPASKAFILQKLLGYPGVSSAFVRTVAGGVCEVWIDTVSGFTTDQQTALQTFVQGFVPAGIIVAICQAEVVTFDISIKVVPFQASLANLSALNQQITSVLNSYISSLDIATGLPVSQIRQLVAPLVQTVTVITPSADLTAQLNQVLVLSSLNISYPGS